MKRILLLGAIVACSVGSSTAQAAVEVNETVTESFSVFVPCLNGGAGEVLSGDIRLHVLITMTVNGNRVSGKFHFQPQGGGLVGETTGVFYHATGVTQGTFAGSLVNNQYSESFVNNFRLIGAGPGNSFLEHEVFHITITPDGEVRVEFDHLSSECK